jgi:hypothetical protein
MLYTYLLHDETKLKNRQKEAPILVSCEVTIWPTSEAITLPLSLVLLCTARIQQSKLQIFFIVFMTEVRDSYFSMTS